MRTRRAKVRPFDRAAWMGTRRAMAWRAARAYVDMAIVAAVSRASVAQIQADAEASPDVRALRMAGAVIDAAAKIGDELQHSVVDAAVVG